MPPAIPDATTTPPRRPRQDQHAKPAEDQPAAERADEGHVDDVEAERAQAAVGENERLHDEHDGDAERSEPGADEHGGEQTPEKMAARAARDGEVEHLHGEDECGDEPGQRNLLLLHGVGGLPEADGHAGHGDDAGAGGGAGIDEPVGNVHASPAKCNSDCRSQ